LLSISRSLAVRDSLSRAALSVLQELTARFDETTYVCLRQGSHGVFVYDVQTSNPVRYVLDLGRPFPLHIGASGRAVLTGLASEEVAEVIASLRLEPATGRTITDPGELLRVVDADRAVGYSVSLSERLDGGSAVASPFFDATGVCLGAVVLTCPISRLDRDRVPELGEAVATAAHALSISLGHRQRRMRTPTAGGCRSIHRGSEAS
jgi:DNA-binding IclR family transcriptional regulator